MVAKRIVTEKKTGKKRGKKKAAGAASAVTTQSDQVSPEKGFDGTLILDGNLCIPKITVLREHLSTALEADGPIVIEATAVEAADTATLQLLTAFVNAARGQSRTVEWRGASQVLVDVAGLLDLDQAVGINGDPVAAQADDISAVA